MAEQTPSPLPVRILDTGHCLHLEGFLMEGGRWAKVECHCLVALFQHPRHGWVLWDTGYGPRMLEETGCFPYRLYRVATPLRLRPELAVAAQLPRLGLTPEEVRVVVVSHFHADHLCGLRDFPQARLVATREAYEDAVSRSGWQALRRGFIPALLPEDFQARAEWVEQFQDESLGALGPTHDLFGDGTLRLVPLPGHARGQVGLFAQTERGPMLFAADGAWLGAAVREVRPPHRMTQAVADDPAQVLETLQRLHAFMKEFPEVTLVPTHCPEAYAALAERP